MKISRISWALSVAIVLACDNASAQPEPLTPIVNAVPSAGEAPLTVFFDASESIGKWGTVASIDSFEWDFDFDGAIFEPASSLTLNPVVTYTYDAPGTYTVRLRVTDTPNTTEPREAFLDVTIEVSPAERDPAERTEYPPGTPGAGIQNVWTSPEELEAAAGYVRPVDQIFMQWDQVEPEEHGAYDWTRLHDRLADADAAGHWAAVQINSRLPSWVFDHIAITGTARDMSSPQFWDPDYVVYYEELIDELAAQLEASPHRDLVLYVRGQWNAVHTETTYYDSTVNGDAQGTWVDNPSWVWPSDGHRYEVEWTEEIANDYERNIMARFLEHFGPLGIGVTLRTIGGHLPVAEQNSYYARGDEHAWILITNANYMKWDGGLQHTRELTIMRCLGALGFEETKSDVVSRIAEINPELTVEQDIYGVVLRALAVGLPYIGMYGYDLALAESNVDVQRAYDFANRYAGWHLYPRSTPGAWIVLGRFEGTTDWRRLNTVAQDNWSYFIRQNEPSETSTPLSLVGDPPVPFGLTAREIALATSFDLDDAFADQIRAEEVLIHVVSLVESGTMDLLVDQSGELVTLEEESHDDDRGWRTSTYRVVSPAFSDGLDGRTDLVLEAVSGAPIVHRLEIERTGIPSATDGDADSDADADGDVDADGDGDSDGDGDIDSDVDADTDSDADGGQERIDADSSGDYEDSGCSCSSTDIRSRASGGLVARLLSLVAPRDAVGIRN